MTGYYRVNYDTKNWMIISAFLQFENFSIIPAVSRAQLINDVYYFTLNRELNNFHIFYSITKYLAKETDYIAWYPMFNIFSYMSTYFELPQADAITVSKNTFHYNVY